MVSLYKLTACTAEGNTHTHTHTHTTLGLRLVLYLPYKSRVPINLLTEGKGEIDRDARETECIGDSCAEGRAIEKA